MLQFAPCVVPGKTKSRYEIPEFQLTIADCTECGTGRHLPMPSATRIRSFYPESYYGSTGKKFTPMVEKGIQLVGGRLQRFIAGRTPSGGRVLDVGCGRGFLLRGLADRGYRTFGTEVSADAANGSDERSEISIVNRLEDAGYEERFFDCAVLWHVFEHLVDPNETLTELYRIIKPGGLLLIAVPNYSSFQAKLTGRSWFHLDPPRHLYHYPAAALRAIAANHGFRCQSTHHFSIRQNPFGWVQSLLNSVLPTERNLLYSKLHRHPGRDGEISVTLRYLQYTAYIVGMPVALLVSVAAAVLRRGATVHIVAERS